MRVLLLLLTLLIYPILWVVVVWRFGQVEGIRFAGIGVLLIWLEMVTASRLFLRSEGREIAVLRGWMKFLVVLPLLAAGLLVVIYPHEAACIGGISLKGC
ncbi:hypothetical protein ACEN8I_21850 [Polaromonas sp. CT11-55]|uniref:hypothetical protein n=1 Tax=Polaromonas sp. CT11-55 TaxID=3243045 RepID=UPI0039A48AC9